jgi:hypothetical protein
MNLENATPEVLRAIVEMEREKSDNFFALKVELVDRLNQAQVERTALLTERDQLRVAVSQYGDLLATALETIDWAITTARRAREEDLFISWSDRRIQINQEYARIQKEIGK